MTDPAPLLVVFGIDSEGKARASRFADRDAELAIKAATLLGFRVASMNDEAGRDIANALACGNVFARGNGFVRLVRQSVFARLCTVVDGGVAATPEQPGSNEG
jgi:hypothetical protein